MKILDQFKSITSLDIELFLNNVSDFISDNYQSIVNYYTKDTAIDGNIFIDLDNLIDTSILINSAFSNFRDQLSLTTEFWKLIDIFDEARVKLLTIQNSERWLRATKDTLFNDSVSPSYVLRQQQTIENVSKDLGDTIPQDDWVDLAIKNDLEERDYDTEGGNLLYVSYSNNARIQINTVVASLQGKGVYGLDIDKTFVIDTITEDLKVLTNDETIKQSFLTLISTMKGSIPEFTDDGVDKTIIGTNLNSIQFPIIFRQISTLFQKDDRFKNFSIISIDQQVSSVEIVLQATTRLDEVLKQDIVL